MCCFLYILSSFTIHFDKFVVLLEKLDKMCPNFEAWDEVWGGRINVDPGYIYESTSGDLSVREPSVAPSSSSAREPSLGPPSSLGSASDGDTDINILNNEDTTSQQSAQGKTSKKRGSWAQASDVVLDLEKERNNLIRQRMERKYQHLEKQTETKKEVELLRMKLELEKVKLERERLVEKRERVRLEAAKLGLSVDLPEIGGGYDAELDIDEPQ